jgi:hypothetical protein
MVDYSQNAALLGGWLPDATLVTLHGGSHTGFAGMSRLFRWFDNPDSIGCWAMRGKLDDMPEVPDRFISRLRGYESATLAATELHPCRDPELPVALRPQQQLMLTKFAVLAFFESQFHPEPREQKEYMRILLQSLAQEYPQITVTSGHDGDDH